jgi:hypothetical protein
MNPFDKEKEPTPRMGNRPHGISGKLHITVQLPDVTYDQIVHFAGRFGCVAHATKDKDIFRIESDDPMNFYWLGVNIHNDLLNKLMPSSLSKFTPLKDDMMDHGAY